MRLADGTSQHPERPAPAHLADGPLKDDRLERRWQQQKRGSSGSQTQWWRHRPVCSDGAGVVALSTSLPRRQAGSAERWTRRTAMLLESGVN